MFELGVNRMIERLITMFSVAIASFLLSSAVLEISQGRVYWGAAFIGMGSFIAFLTICNVISSVIPRR